MKYRIGEVAELFGLTKGGVRYLEEKGVIRSRRDARNGYRYYDREQITDIKQLRSYQAMGFSLDESMDLMQSDPDRVLSCIECKERSLLDQIRHTRRMIAALKKQRDRIAAAHSAGDVWTVSPRPALFRISVWEDLIRQGVLPEWADPETVRARKEAEAAFISCMPEVTLSLLVRRTKSGYVVARGSCVEQEDARRLNMPLNSQVDEYPACESCYWSVIQSRMSDREGLAALFHQVERMEGRGERLIGDIIGRLLLRRRDADDCIVFHEFWIPFQRA